MLWVAPFSEKSMNSLWISEHTPLRVHVSKKTFQLLTKWQKAFQNPIWYSSEKVCKNRYEVCM